MLSKLQNVKQSLRDVTAAIGDKTNAALAEAKKKITEIQTLPSEIPESWEERIDENGKPYFVDTETGEWYRLKSKQHKRIDTSEKLSIITAESKKEFDDQKKQMDLGDSDESDSDIHTSDDNSNNNTDEITNDNNTKQDIDINIHQNGITNTNTNKKPKSGHSKRSSTSVSKGWQCEKCTLENVGHAMQCNACLAPRPDTLDDDEDEMALNNGMKEHVDESDNTDDDDDDSDEDDNDDDDDDDDDNAGGHVQVNTIDAINSAVDESLSAVDGIDVKSLTKDQRSKLITFMDFVEAEPKPSLRYLRESNWDIQVAMDTYLRQHPDHPKSRGGSLQFDLQQIAELYTDPIDFEADIELPHDISGAGAGRRDSTELDAPPNNDGVRDSNSDDNSNVADNNSASDSDSDKGDSDNEIEYGHNNNNGVRNEYIINDQYGAHRRMNTDQQIQIAEKLSIAQSEYDQQLDKYRKEIEALKQKLAEKEEENIALIEEKDRYAIQAREIQNDWDRMSGYMTQILSEVAHIEDQRKLGNDIATPTPKLHNLFESIQNTITDNDLTEIEEAKLENGKMDIYSNVADLFSDQAPVLNVKNESDKVNNNKKRKLSFGAVNELFTAIPMGEINTTTKEINSGGNNNLLSVEEDDAHAKRLSYGGVGLLFDAFDGNDETNNVVKKDNNMFSPNQNENINDNPLNVSFTPTYDGIATLFDENNDILGTKSGGHRNKPSFAGDIVELFRNPNNEYASIPEEDNNEQEQEQEQPEEEEEEDNTSDDSDMDKQRVYTYSNDEDEEEEEEEEYKSASDKDIEPDVKKDNKRPSTHQRFESYASNASDPTPMSRRGSTSKKRHSRDTSFAFKDLFRGEEDSDNSDRAPSVQSAPEEHDYYAITAYYGIEDDDDAQGWDSRRSSMFGDYGRVHSRRQSKRVQSGMVEDNIKDMFKVDLSNKLTQHLSAGATENIDNVADLFYDETKLKSKPTTISEEPYNDNNNAISDNAHVVADLFDESNNNIIKAPIDHKKRDTYTGVKQLFGDDNNESDNENENDTDDIDDDEFVEMRDNNLQLNSNNKQVPRPSTNVALGATFDSISMIKDRVPKKNKEEIKEETKKQVQEPIVEEPIVQPPQIVQAEISERQLEEMRNKIQGEEDAKLLLIQQALEDKKLKLEQEYNNKLEIMRREIETTTSERLKEELTINLRESIRNELRNNLELELTPQIKLKCREEIELELNNKFETQLNDKLNEKFASELENKLSDKVNGLTNTFEIKINELQNKMDEREQIYKSEMKVMEQSKCDLIQRTAKEIDSLRQIIKSQFNQNQTMQNNNGILSGLLKWG